MSVVKRHDVVQTSLLMSDRKQEVNKILKDLHSGGEAAWQQRDRLIKDLHATEVNSVRQHASLAIDHQKLCKAEFTESWTGSLGLSKESKRHRKLFVFRTPVSEEKEPTFYVLGLDLIPSRLAGFQAMKKKYQYFKINKISVKFVANSATNLAPIICRYVPPMPKYANLDDMDKDIQSNTLDLEYVTKYAESKGSDYGFISIHCPPCLIKVGQFDKEGEFTYGENGMCMANLCKDRCICDYAKYNQQLDFGTFIFESRNLNEQNIIAQVHYQIDFYTGVDFEAATYSSSTWGGDGSAAGEDGEETDDEDGGNQEESVPDELPKHVPQPRGNERSSEPKGMVKKTFGKR